jgi:hypothetical protein
MPSVVVLSIASVKPSMCLSRTSEQKTAIFNTTKSSLPIGRRSSFARYPAVNSQLTLSGVERSRFAAEKTQVA